MQQFFDEIFVAAVRMTLWLVRLLVTGLLLLIVFIVDAVRQGKKDGSGERDRRSNGRSSKRKAQPVTPESRTQSPPRPRVSNRDEALDWLAKLQRRYPRQAAEIRKRWEASLARAESRYKTTLNALKAEGPSVSRQWGLVAAGWDEAQWADWEPHPGDSLPVAVRIGTATIRGKWAGLVDWLLVQIPGVRNCVLEAVDEQTREEAIKAVRSIALRLLATSPPGKLRLLMIDPLGLGQNLAAFMPLADYDSALVTDQVWTRPRHIDEQLTLLTEHMENVIQKYLQDRFDSMEAYNSKAGHVAEPYRLVLVTGFPENFSESAAKMLLSVAAQGPRCGVNSIIVVDRRKEVPRGFELADLEATAFVVRRTKRNGHWETSEIPGAQIALDEPPESNMFDHVLKQVGEVALETRKVEVPFDLLIPAPHERWNEKSASGLIAPLGPAGANKIQQLSLGEGVQQHVLVAGKTGSGKSTLLHVIIMSLALRYSPEELELYLVDFKKGVEFKAYASYQLPHARVVAIESEREFGVSVLEGLDQELRRRGDVFRSNGCQDIQTFRQRSDRKLPRILLIVDEFHEFFTENDALATKAATILDRLVRQGRAFGMHVLLGSQSLAGPARAMIQGTVDQMAIRIALQCSEADSGLILAQDNLAARILERPGQAIYNAANGRVGGNDSFQVAWLSDPKRVALLDQLRHVATEIGLLREQVVFEGDELANIATNQLLRNLLDAPSRPREDATFLAWVGDPIAIKDPTSVEFLPQSASNLLITGPNEDVAAGIVTAALLSLAAQLRSATPFTGLTTRFYVLDFSSPHTNFAASLSPISRVLAHQMRIGRRRELSSILSDLAGELRRRRTLVDADSVNRESLADLLPPTFLILFGLHRARDLRIDEFAAFESPGDAASVTLTEQWKLVVREGPELGFHTIAWCDNLNNLGRVMDRRTISEFALRIAYQMSHEDLGRFIGTSIPKTLAWHRALLSNEELGLIEKLIPYSLPDHEWITKFAEHLATKEGTQESR